MEVALLPCDGEAFLEDELPGEADVAEHDVSRVAGILHELFHPDKINFGAYGDTMHHLHFHLVPKYRDGFEWGGVFAMNPNAVTLSPEEYDQLVRMIREKL